jgi:hypothetical protein
MMKAEEERKIIKSLSDGLPPLSLIIIPRHHTKSREKGAIKTT